MSTARVPFSAVQSVRQGSGGLVRTTSVVVQAVSKATPPEVRASFVVAQVVGRISAAYVRATQVSLQVVRQGSDGAMARVASAAFQVVWATGDLDGSRQRAWTFDFDGHTFYVLDLGASGTPVYDTLTGQWSRFRTAGYGGWNFKNGFHWRTGKMVIGGADGSGQLLRLSAQSFLDEGWRPVIYEVRGMVQTTSKDFIRQYALRMIGATGLLADSISPATKMQFSDDRGVTWSPVFTLELTPNSRQRIEFRSLGAFTAPGRIFRIYDEGGIKFIANVEAHMGGEDGRTPA